MHAPVKEKKKKKKMHMSKIRIQTEALKIRQMMASGSRVQFALPDKLRTIWKKNLPNFNQIKGSYYNVLGISNILKIF